MDERPQTLLENLVVRLPQFNINIESTMGGVALRNLTLNTSNASIDAKVSYHMIALNAVR